MLNCDLNSLASALASLLGREIDVTLDSSWKLLELLLSHTSLPTTNMHVLPKTTQPNPQEEEKRAHLCSLPPPLLHPRPRSIERCFLPIG